MLWFCFRKFYAELSDLCTTTSVILFVFCQTALFRIAPILTCVFIVITLHQCICSWIGTHDLDDRKINKANDSVSKIGSNSSNRSYTS